MSRTSHLVKRASKKPRFTPEPEPSPAARMVSALRPEEALLVAIFPKKRAAILRQVAHALSNGCAFDPAMDEGDTT